MTTLILATKLYVPTSRNNRVVRHHLTEQLNTSIHSKLILISAPVGFGKTTLISEWLNSNNIPTAWLSLDKGDNDLSRFQTYLVAALKTIAPNIGENVMTILQSNQLPAIESILTLLLNDLANVPKHFVLVLDDYHLIEAKSVNDAVIFLLEHLPSQMRLIITTREDPNLPLARLRARGQLTELRATDLRFTLDEASDFLGEVMGLNLTVEAITALEERTEGWIAGLQLAALSLQGRKDISGFIQSFAGSHRYIVDYLVEEVLANQPENVRDFLTKSSILNRFNGELCDAVTGQATGSEMIQALVRGNFFLIPLDDQRQWYRYHHLFADVLRLHLKTEQSQYVASLHQRASDWYEQNGWLAEAVHHALSGRDFERAARLIETTSPDMRRTRQEATLLGWFKALPDVIYHNRPVLNIEYIGALLSTGETKNVETRLQDAERWLQDNPNANPSSAMTVINQQEFYRLPGWIALYRAGLSLVLGNVPDTVTYARQVLDFISEDDHLLHGAASAILGLTAWSSGDLELAYQSYADGMAHLKKAGNISDVVGGSLGLADIRITQGRLREAVRVYERALELAIQHGNPQMRGTADMYVGLSEINRQYNKLHLTEQYLLKAKVQGDYNGFPQNPYRWHIAMAHLHQAKGDFDEALDLLQEAEQLYVSDFYPNVRPVAGMKTRILIAQGKLDDAFSWVREQGLSVDDELGYLREFEHITLARVLLAQYQFNPDVVSLTEAMNFLERLLKEAEDGRRTGSMIEILVLQALAYQMHSDISNALIALEHALKLAEPEGYIRVFMDEGSNMESLLHEAAELKIMPDYATRLLDAFHEHQTVTYEPHIATMLPSQDLIEPLSQRELEVLRLFKTDLSGPEIARELVIGLSTVRTHTKSIYSKLNVNNRRSAVTRATELKLI